MSTNERKIIRLQHVPTGSMVDCELARDVSPSLVNRVAKRDELTKKVQRLQDKNEGVKLSDEQKQQLSELYLKITRHGLYIMAMALEPIDPIPDEYDNKLEYISDCACSGAVVNQVINFFYTYLPSSMPSHEDLDSPEYKQKLSRQVQIIDPDHPEGQNSSPSKPSGTSGD